MVGLSLNVDRGWCGARFRVVTIKAIIHKAEEGGYWAEVPALPGCVTPAETMEDLRTNLREAIEGWLEAGSDFSGYPNAMRQTWDGITVRPPDTHEYFKRRC